MEKDGLSQGGGSRSDKKSGGHHGKPSGFPGGLEMKEESQMTAFGLSIWKPITLNCGVQGGYKWGRVQLEACL